MCAANCYAPRRDEEHPEFMALGSMKHQTSTINLITLQSNPFHVKHSACHSSRGQ